MTQPAPVLDHLVLAAPDLAAAVAWFTDRSRVVPARGGSHVGLGTANWLVGLGEGAYLEIVGPDPDQPPPARPRPFGVDELAGPRLITWAVRTDDIDALVAQARAQGYDPGDPLAMSRRTPDGALLEWRLTAPRLDAAGGLVPFVIDWGSSPHPTSRDLPQIGLRELRATHPHPHGVLPALATLGVELHIDAGEVPLLNATLEGPDGPVHL